MDRREYYTEIQSLAEEAAKRIRAGEDQGDVVHELVDDHQWVIYTSRNFEVMAASDVNPWDVAEDFGDKAPSSPAVAAYFCMYTDVNDALARLDLVAANADEEEPDEE